MTHIKGKCELKCDESGAIVNCRSACPECTVDFFLFDSPDPGESAHYIYDLWKQIHEFLVQSFSAGVGAMLPQACMLLIRVVCVHRLYILLKHS